MIKSAGAANIVFILIDTDREYRNEPKKMFLFELVKKIYLIAIFDKRMK